MGTNPHGNGWLARSGLFLSTLTMGKSNRLAASSARCGHIKYLKLPKVSIRILVD